MSIDEPGTPDRAPPGLPDAATLSRWANELFAALPSKAGAATSITPSAPVLAPPEAARLPASADPSVPFVVELPRLSARDLVTPPLELIPPTLGLGTVPLHEPPIRHPSTTPNFYFMPDPTAVPAASSAAHRVFDVQAVRRDFPILATRINGHPLVWLDNAATTQKPTVVIERLSYFYRHENSNIHRGAHELAARATDAYEAARRQAQQFLGAASPEEIVFVRGATEAINLVAQSWGRKYVSAGDEIIVSHLEHHANIVPWQMLARERGAALKVIPVDSSGQIRLDELGRLVTDRTKLVSIAHVSNALGTITPVREVIEIAHRRGALALIDGAQSASHMPIDVQSLGADFFVLSGHKVFGPTGIGVLYGRQAVLEDMPPWQGGGSMIEDVTFEETRFQRPPARFEAGTGNIADAIALGAAFEYLGAIGMPLIARYEAELLAYATERLASVPRLHMLGTAAEKASVLSFWIDGLEPQVIGSALNQEGIAVRAGHHCAQPIHRRFGHEASVRASLALYNTCEEVDALVAALKRIAASKPLSHR